MYNITLLSSFHDQKGKCSSDELLKILNEIQPDVIFEELPQYIFDIIYTVGFQPQSLEAIAIKVYCTHSSIKHFAVDSYRETRDPLFNDYDLIANTNTLYKELFINQLNGIYDEGFKFLNSDELIEIFDKLHNIETEVLQSLNDKVLFNQYKADAEVFEKRETEMLLNIYKLSLEHPYEKALFICGAEHRKSMITKIEKFNASGPLKLNWDFYGS